MGMVKGLVVFAFDCDGTLQPGGGPISLDTLQELKKYALVYIVSPSGACKNLNFPHYTVFGGRHLALEGLKAKVKAERYIYVGDTITDQLAAQVAGWEFIYADEFEIWIRQ